MKTADLCRKHGISEASFYIISAVQMLIVTHQNRDQGSLPTNRLEWQGTIWEGINKPDPIPPHLDRIVAAIKDTCRPAIQEAVK
jgi:hypothetical protein